MPIVAALAVEACGAWRRPFKGMIFSGNMFELLKNIKDVGNDLAFYGMFGLPTLLTEGLKISGARTGAVPSKAHLLYFPPGGVDH